MRTMVEIPLTDGFVTVVNKHDAARLLRHDWFVLKVGKHPKRRLWYAARYVTEGGTRRTVLMHREILGVPDSLTVDHRNGNGLDNRRGNLRPATRRDQMRNKRKAGNQKTSRYKGVYWSHERKIWCVQIRINRKLVASGRSLSEKDAAELYNLLAKHYYGEFARPNKLRRRA